MVEITYLKKLNNNNKIRDTINYIFFYIKYVEIISLDQSLHLRYYILRDSS